MTTEKIFTIAASTLLAASLATPALAAKTGSGKSKSVFSQEVSGKKKSSTQGFGSVFRRDAGVNQNRKLRSSRGPGFDLGFDGHSGGL